MISGNIEKFSSPVRRITGKVELFQEGSTPLTFAHDGDLISFVVDKTGENSKFFGFGVCQKIEVKIRDKDRQYTITDQDYLKPYIDNLAVLPLFYVKEIKRNENTNDLTVIAYDAIETANRYAWDELSITDYTLKGIAQAIGSVIGVNGVICEYEEFNTSYENNINVNGNESLRHMLDDIAEATQTIYYIDNNNNLVFKRLDIAAAPVYTIDKAQYFTLKSEVAKTLTSIASITELGDNIQASEGETQYVRNNAFWTLREDIADIVEAALNNVNGTTIIPFDCSWRGNYLLEIGDKIGITTKDDEVISTYFLNDKLTYTGGMSQHTQWSYKASETVHTNPSTLGEVINQTTAKVDKVNKEISLVVNETNKNSSEVAAMKLNTDSITASVSSLETKVNETVDDMNLALTEMNTKVSATITSEDLEIAVSSRISEGIDKVVTTEKKYTFDDTGLSISSSENVFATTITEDGMTVRHSGEDVLTANNEGVKAVDLHATTFLVIGKYSRLQDMPGETRTGCFWIGG